ncbi:hypothetical protein V8J36_10410 [Frigidibacter sp. MR17.14]|uniref:hypothetical protein n=1 Tax=Frigidibacter sp. MR17.14 TaxID=3126509 RepID=UPI003012A5C1
MDEPVFRPGGGRDLPLPGSLLAETAELYDDAARSLFAVLREIKQGDTARAREAQAAVRELKAAFQLAMEERSRVEKLGRDAAGQLREQTLDFDAARAEIGRRLAVLRDGR